MDVNGQIVEHLKPSDEGQWGEKLALLEESFGRSDWVDRINYRVFEQFMFTAPIYGGRIMINIPGPIIPDDLQQLYTLLETSNIVKDVEIALKASWARKSEFQHMPELSSKESEFFEDEVRVLIKVDSPGLERCLETHGPVLSVITDYADKSPRRKRIYFV